MIDPLAYVTAAAPTVGLDLSADRLQAVAAAFALVAQLGAPALAFELPPDTEPAPVFTP